jgi:L-aspartate oxidase
VAVRVSDETSVSADFLVLGSGIAGLRAAATLAAHGRVLILTKSDPKAGSTGFAQGGVAAAVGPGDSPALHAKDTLAAGDGLCRAEAVDVLVHDGPRDVEELIRWGAAFDRRADGSLSLAREGAHSVRRVLHARDATGREIGRTLGQRIASLPAVDVRDFAVAVQLIVERASDGTARVAGARYRRADGTLGEARAKATLIATGGAGQVYRETTNPSVACGDGIALGYLAGAAVTDMEFVQFHPTALDMPGTQRALVSEALRGEGARLVNDAGELFMTRYDPAGELAPRDRVARAILLEKQRTGGRVYLTMDRVRGDVHERFPLVSELCRAAGLDLATDRIPVTPAEHYLMGGVATDLDGRTSVRDLYAAGEAACTGVHGANRLASNSLLEGLVFGARAAAAMAGARSSGQWQGPVADVPLHSAARRTAFGAATAESMTRADVQDLMWSSVGVFRDGPGLVAAVSKLEGAWQAVRTTLDAGDVPSGEAWTTTSTTVVARLIARAALRREESRGAHARTDFPKRDDLHWTRHIFEDREDP